MNQRKTWVRTSPASGSWEWDFLSALHHPHASQGDEFKTASEERLQCLEQRLQAGVGSRLRPWAETHPFTAGLGARLGIRSWFNSQVAYYWFTGSPKKNLGFLIKTDIQTREGSSPHNGQDSSFWSGSLQRHCSHHFLSSPRLLKGEINFYCYDYRLSGCPQALDVCSILFC